MKQGDATFSLGTGTPSHWKRCASAPDSASEGSSLELAAAGAMLHRQASACGLLWLLLSLERGHKGFKNSAPVCTNQ